MDAQRSMSKAAVRVDHVVARSKRAPAPTRGVLLLIDSMMMMIRFQNLRLNDQIKANRGLVSSPDVVRVESGGRSSGHTPLPRSS